VPYNDSCPVPYVLVCLVEATCLLRHSRRAVGAIVDYLYWSARRIIYCHYRVTVIGSVPIKMQLSSSQEIETRKLAFCLRGEIDKTTLHKKPRKKYAEDGRLNAYGAGGRKPPTISVCLPCVCSLSHCSRLTNIIPSLPLSICPFLRTAFCLSEGALVFRRR
jgi:hypothetical protein